MGKVLKIFGALFFGLIIVIGAIAAYGFLVGPRLDAESKLYVDSTIPILTNDWNPEELTKRSSKELLSFLKEPDLSNLYVVFRKLGRMTLYKGSKGESHTNLNMPSGILTTAGYVASADFENGPGMIKLSLIKRNGTWQILEFRIDSPVFQMNQPYISQSGYINPVNISFSKNAEEMVASGKFDELIGLATEQKSKFPSDPYSYYYLGLGQYHKREYREAVENFNKAAELAPTWKDQTIKPYLEAAERALANGGSK